MNREPGCNGSRLTLSVELSADQLDLICERVTQLIEERRDDGFLDTAGAASYLGLTKSAVYHLVGRDKLPHHRAGGRLLFDRRQLRAWVEARP